MMNWLWTAGLMILLLTSLQVSAQQVKPGEGTSRFSLDEGWLFHLGDIPFAPLLGHGASYMASKAGIAPGAAAVDYDDSQWLSLNLPHDWAIEQPVDSTENISQGYHKRGFGWYRRRFKLDTADKGKNLELQFEGIATHATIWVNGQVVYRSWSAYNAFYIDITAIARYGEDVNTIAVKVDANAMEGWWYEGAGIYRHTWLVKRSPVHIVTDGVFAHPVLLSAAGDQTPASETTNLAHDNWCIPAEITIANTGKQKASPHINISLYNRHHQLVTTADTVATVNALEQTTVKLNLSVTNPLRWTLEDPALYTVVTKLQSNNDNDEVITRCGFRTIRFDADSGFYLNNKRVKIKGVCNHIDHAGVGTAVPDALWDFRMQKIKEMGANAYRCAHNAPASRILDLCDSLGILVMDENRNFNTSPEYLAQLAWLVKRDRNHPSVILWSVFNEEPIQGTETGYEMVRRLSKQVKIRDTTRPVTAAMNGGFFSEINVSQAVDVVGFNYEIKHYDRFHALNPRKPVTSSEDASGVMVRGEYYTNTVKHILDAYDTQAPSWGATHRKAWKLIDERPWMAGAFVWTGFDYHGEPTPFRWPTVSSNFGILDLCGFPKTAFYLRQALWIKDKPILHIAPHWNFPKDSIGKPVKVMVISNAEKVKLLLNGKTIGEQQNDPYNMVSWQVPYKPGKLEAIGFRNGKQVSRFQVQTTGAPVRLRLTPFRPALDNSGTDATPVTVEALDANGRHVPDANLPVSFNTSNAGRIIGLGNGNPNSHEPEKGNHQSLFNGFAQVIVQPLKGETTNLVLEATAPGLEPATLSIPLQQVAAQPSLPASASILTLDKWRMSPVFNTRPNPAMALSDNDMNSWMATQPGKLQEATSSGYVIYRAAFTPYAAQQEMGGNIYLKPINGDVEIWINDKKIAEQTVSPVAKEIKIPFPVGKTHTINILVKQEKGTYTGLNGPVIVAE
ncbi:beta-galactosidase GalA [Filimonas effusa]|uniref:Glycoside hydrolase family 2 protein n=1 Tax=Filimonas effusa TaxID=2508721 RepID=A0A4Q1D616_9BACT|nr:beta-galactosidase GalA [Filimonas effusa]RXK83899.1 glycoside hydrolase family 2 protein [Filimonas effusa]